MFKNRLRYAMCIALTGLLFSCQTSDEDDNMKLTESASYKVNGSAIEVDDPYNGLFINNGLTNNNITLTGKDKSEIRLSFDGTAPATIQLKSFGDASYKDSQGKQYYAVRGQLNVTDYSTQNGENVFSGTFSFVAKSSTNGRDSVTISEGVIKNCSNAF